MTTKAPFSLEKALAGHPLVTRDGRRVKFVAHVPECDNGYRVLAYCEGHGHSLSFFDNGRCYDGLEQGSDLLLAVDSFDDPPDGQEWHNPAGLTPEQVGVQDGWRLLLKSEISWDGKDYLIDACDRWATGDWSGRNHGARLDYTYRTRQPLPQRVKLVPLGPEDVRPGDVIRASRQYPYDDLPFDWYLVLAANQTSAATRAATYPYHHLQEHGFEISHDGGATWGPCSKVEGKS